MKKENQGNGALFDEIRLFLKTRTEHLNTMKTHIYSTILNGFVNRRDTKIAFGVAEECDGELCK